MSDIEEENNNDNNITVANTTKSTASPSTAASSTSATSATASSLTTSSPDGLRPRKRQSHRSRLLQFSSNRGYVFTIVSYLIGVFIFATIVGQVGNVITNRNANRLEFERLLDGAKTYMRHHKVPGGMKRRVLRWYDYSWSRGRIQGGGDINTALGLLPDKLKTELALHVNLSVLKKVTIFQECQPEFLHDLVLKMKAYIFTPGDLICRKGEVAREMFIIADGILEVISETGRVLTTMKAGDFFGEIGILNLDGLNKRTADVRSVGYSELFSLSREDVLAAMKDYPEAQEILQSLGRKRLMEARNVSRPKSSGHHDKGASSSIGSPAMRDGVTSAESDSRAGKRIVEKLRSDVKGLKNVLRKSRRGTRTKDESMELQPLNPGSLDTGRPTSTGHTGKGVLRRMSRVRSDENYSHEGSLEDQSPAAPTAKLGEGLPLLQRLRLLKEKQDREERGKPLLTPTSPPPITGSVSPPALKLHPSDKQDQSEQEQEVIGAGLPLIQRLLLLKQKEDRERLAIQATAAVAADVLASTVKSEQVAESSLSPPGRKTKGSVSDDSKHSSSSKEHSEDESTLTSRKPSLLNRLVPVKHKDSIGASVPKQLNISSAGVAPHQKSDSSVSCSGDPSTSAIAKVPHLRDKLKLLTQKDNAPHSSSSSSSTGTVISPPPKAQAQASAKSDSESASNSVPVLKKQHSWSLLKKASILSSQNSSEQSSGTKSTKSNTTRDVSSSFSDQVKLGGSESVSLLQTKQGVEMNMLRTVSTTETKVITVCDNSDSESIPSKTSLTSIKASEVSCGKSVPLFKQKVGKIISDDQKHGFNIQDKLKTIEASVIAQGEGKQGEDNKEEENLTDACIQGEETLNFESSLEGSSTASMPEGLPEFKPSVTVSDSPAPPQADLSAVSPQRKRPKPNLRGLQQDTKFYMSIDDLSPEYSGLPFVKKLKILNERQKLAELEQKVAHVLMRSSSLDSSNTVSGATSVSGDSGDYIFDPMNLTRSHSEASAMQYVRSHQINRECFNKTSSQTCRKEDEEGPAMPPQRPTELPQPPDTSAAQSLTSPESNETLERRNLKSILKKLSATSLFSTSSEDTKEVSAMDEVVETTAVKETEIGQPVAKPATIDMRKLMRAPTIEGYAARHSKLMKSVTFNRDTLQSPPATATTPTKLSQEPTGTLFPLPIISDNQIQSAISTTSVPTSTTIVSTTSAEVSSVGLPVTQSIDTSTIPVAETETIIPVTIALITTMPSVVVPAVTTTISTTPAVVSSSSVLPKTTCELSSVIVTTAEMSTRETESTVKKKPQVSFLMQHPHQIPLSANEKNFFRPSLLLPSHASLEEEYFNEVIIGIKQVIQGHLEEIQNKFQSQFQSLESELKRRDEIISQLQKRIHELEHPESTKDHNENGDRKDDDDGDNEEDEEDGDHDDEVDVSDADDASDQPFMRGDSVDTVLSSPPPILPDEDLEEDEDEEDVQHIESEELLVDERPHQRIISPSHSALRQRQTYRRSWEDHSEEETLELLDLPRSISPQHVWCAEDEEQKATEALRDCIAVDLGSSDTSSSSSSSSESTNDEDDAFAADDDLHSVGHNRDWEVQMLARELERREDISRLEDEVRDLKAAVSSSDLSRLSSSELDILERVLVAKDRKVRAAARALSLDSDDSYSEERSLHPVPRHKPEVRSPSLSSVLNKRRLLKQRSTNGGGSIENLLYRTSILKNRLLSATSRRHQLLNARSLDEAPETSQKTTVSTSEHRRNRSASSGNITPIARPTSFGLPSASSLMRGLGNLVRNSPSTSTSHTSHQGRHSLTSLESGATDRATVPTISRTCGEVSPDPSQHTNDPPPPDL